MDVRNRKPTVLVETSPERNVPKLKTDDKQLRQAQVGAVTNEANPNILEMWVDGSKVIYTPPGQPVPYLTIDSDYGNDQ